MTAFSSDWEECRMSVHWHIKKLCRKAKLGRFRGMADIEQAAPHSIRLKLPTSRQARLY
jgi:hypothetical protein